MSAVGPSRRFAAMPQMSEVGGKADVRAARPNVVTDPFPKQELGASVHVMFSIFYDDVLIGRSELERGDPPMGVAFGRFEPTDAFAPLRNAMKLVCNGAGKEQRDARYLVRCLRTNGGRNCSCLFAR